MLKTRVIPTLLYREGSLFKGERFDSWRRIGAAMQSIKVYNLRDVDELVLLDIAATKEQRGPDFEAIDELADECFMPLTVGGGVRSVHDVRRLLEVGADKVSIGTAAVERIELIAEVAQRFGSQCVVVSIDVRRINDRLEVYTRAGSQPTGVCPLDLARRVEQAGAGEILLTAVDRDGTMMGYDNALIKAVCGAVSIPVIASGGAGTFDHMLEAIQHGASAVAAASIFHFTQGTPGDAKRYLASYGVPVRFLGAGK